MARYAWRSAIPIFLVGAGFAGIYLGIVIPQAWLSLYPSRWRWPLRLAATLLAFPIAGILIGLAMGWWMGYWE